MKTQEHTAGAERAARVILAKFGKVHEHWVTDCADIIDRTMQLPLLLDALEKCMKDTFTAADGMTQSGAMSPAGVRYKNAIRAIRSAKGETL